MENILFNHISEADHQKILHCLDARTRTFQAGDVICSFDVSMKTLGILQSGKASIIRYESSGSRTLLEHLGPQDIIGRIITFDLPGYESTCSVCDEKCEILFFNYDHITRPCAKACPCHSQLIQNMLLLMSKHSLELTERVEVLSKRSIREKVMCYLHQQTAKSGKRTLTLPFSLTDLADYLCIDRSAMTRELRKMQNEGLLRINRRVFTLL